MIRPHRLIIKSLLTGIVLCGLLVARVQASVTITSFGAKWNGAQVAVSWATATELNNAGFYVQRSESATGGFARVSPLVRTQNAGSLTGNSYSFADTNVAAGKNYYYKLESVDARGGTTVESSVATAKSAAAPTNTTAPAATATRTAIPGQPTLTPQPTATNTLVPTVGPTPTKTPTLVPGAPTYTPQPPTRVAVVVPQPKGTLPNVNPNANPVATLAPGATAIPTLVALPDSAGSPDAATDNSGDATADQPGAPADDTRLTIVRVGVIGAVGVLMLGALALAAAAAFVYFRMSR